jgi:hypothetical protein
MYVQNGDRPAWAWSGQHVVVTLGWEMTTNPAQPAGERAQPPEPAAADAAAVQEVAGDRPAWSWSGPVA